MGPSYEIASVITMRLLATATMAGGAVVRLSMKSADSAGQWVHMKSWDTFHDLRDFIVAKVAHPSKSRRRSSSISLLGSRSPWWNTCCTWRGLVDGSASAFGAPYRFRRLGFTPGLKTRFSTSHCACKWCSIRTLSILGGALERVLSNETGIVKQIFYDCLSLKRS